MFDDAELLNFALRALAVFVRVSLIIYFLPIFGEAFTPVRVRALLALGLTACLVPMVDIDAARLPTTLWGLALALVPEFLLGLALGLTIRLLFAGVQFAGQVAGEQIGFGIANVIDPSNQAQISITAQVYYLFALLFFLAVNGHHLLLIAVVRSFEMVPMFAFHMPPELFDFLNEQVINLFVVGVMIAAPILTAMLLANLALGLIAKAVPQINIFIESFPIRIALGLFIMGVTFASVGALLADQFSRLDREVMRLLQLLS